MYKSGLQKKLNESLAAVLPIAAIVLVLSLTVAPIPAGTLLGFLLGAALLVVGMTFFTAGAELAMQPMGEKLGAGITKTKKLFLILSVGFLLGVLITISEPDLQVLAAQVQSVPKPVLILSVALGVGIFLVLSLLRILFTVPIKYILLFFYTLVFGLAFFVRKDFLPVAFDSGGVTTGPMTVPFILSFGVGISAIRSDQRAADDSFGLIALCSVGPILSVLGISLLYAAPAGTDAADYSGIYAANASDSVELSAMFLREIPAYMKEIAIAVLPIVLFFAIFQLTLLKLNQKLLTRILVGILYTYIGLVLFLTGANVGFMPAGSYLGKMLASLPYSWITVPVGALIGYFIVRAEPAVYVLMRQVEELTDGAIRGTTIRTCLSIGVSAAVALAMVRVWTGIGILYFLLPGYILALGLSFVVPNVFTPIAFDSGGVASGPMTAAFLLPFAIGSCVAAGGDIFSDAFGVVAMVAMAPLITIQCLGLVYKIKEKKKGTADAVQPADVSADIFEIIEL